MKTSTQIPKNRLEAFSDGIIAIIITVMVFDLKFNEFPTKINFGGQMLKLLPKLISYTFSFLMLAIMWVNHHQLIHQVKYVDRSMLWYNLHLLFWMSLVPFITNLIGSNPMLWEVSSLYGLVFMMNAFSFTILRNYIVQEDLLLESINKNSHLKIKQKNKLAIAIYIIAALASPISVYISFVLFMIVPTMYFIPEKISHTN